MLMMKDSDGEKSLTATLAMVSFIIVMIKVLFGGSTVSFSSFSFTFGAIDSFSIAAILGPTLGTYAARRHTDAKYAVDDTGPVDAGGKAGDGAA